MAGLAVDAATLQRTLLDLQATAGNQAVQLLVQRKDAASRGVAITPPPEPGAFTRIEMSPVKVKPGGEAGEYPIAPEKGPDQNAVQVAANTIDTLFTATRNPAEAVAAQLRPFGSESYLVARAYQETTGRDLRAECIARFSKEDWLIRILALLHTGYDDEPYAQLGLAVIPSGTRDSEVARIISSKVPLHTRQLNKAVYEKAFHGIGRSANDTLEEHLEAAFTTGGEALERALILLARELTPADELHLCSTARWGTDSGKAIEILQREWDKGLEAFSALERQWDELIRGEGRTAFPLHAAMTNTIYGELSGESKEIVDAIFNGYETKTKFLGALNTAGWQGGDARAAAAGVLPEGEAGRAAVGKVATTSDLITTGMEDVDLQVANAAFTAATTGGFIGAGTNNEQVYKAIDTIRTIWEKRIARARDAKDASLVARYQARWAHEQAALREKLEGGVISEMSDLNADLIEAKLRLKGPLKPVDEIWIAGQRYQDALVLDLVTKAWKEGQEEELRKEAETLTPKGQEEIRPPYRIGTVIPQAQPLYWPIYAMIDAGLEHYERGADRLRLQLKGKTASTKSKDLAAGHAFLREAGDARAQVIQEYVKRYLPPPEGDEKEMTPDRRFIHHLRKDFDFTVDQQDMINLVKGPAASIEEHLLRAQIRIEAGKGLFPGALEAGAATVDTITGEDTQELVHEDLRRLERMAKQVDANPAELDAMLAFTGQENLGDLGKLSYEDFKAHHDAARNLRHSIASALEQFIDVAGRSLLMVLFPPTMGWGLAAALGAFMTGMCVRQTLEPADYDLFSMENLSMLLEEVATSAFDMLGFEAVIQELVSAEALASLFKIKDAVKSEAYAKMAQEVIKGSGSKLFEKTVANAIMGAPLPSDTELSARALNMLTLGGLKAATAPMTKAMNAFTPTSARMMTNFKSIIINGPPAKAALPTVLIKEFAAILSDPNFAHMTGPEIAARLAKAGLSTVASATSVTASLTRVQAVEASMIRQVGQRGAEHQKIIDTMVRQDPVLSKPYFEYAASQAAVGHPVLPARLWVKVAGRDLLPGEIEKVLGGDSAFRKFQKDYAIQQWAAGKKVADVKDWLIPANKVHTEIPVIDRELQSKRKLPTANVWKTKMSDAQLDATGKALQQNDPEKVKARVNMDKALAGIYKQLLDVEKK